MDISAQDRKRISTAIRAAEAKTAGEIVCVVARSSSEVTALPVMIASLVALATPWIFVAFTAMTVNRILLLQVVIFVCVMTLLCLPAVRSRLMPRRARRAAAHRAATEQFMIRGIAQTKDRTGVLIFASLAERYARIIADDGIAARVPQARWQSAIDDLVALSSEGRVADGLIRAIERCGSELEQHFPRAKSDRQELPDRVYVI